MQKIMPNRIGAGIIAAAVGLTASAAVTQARATFLNPFTLRLVAPKAPIMARPMMPPPLVSRPLVLTRLAPLPVIVRPTAFSLIFLPIVPSKVHSAPVMMPMNIPPQSPRIPPIHGGPPPIGPPPGGTPIPAPPGGGPYTPPTPPPPPVTTH